jgi:hypothetical protein
MGHITHVVMGSQLAGAVNRFGARSGSDSFDLYTRLFFADPRVHQCSIRGVLSCRVAGLSRPS